MMITTNKNPLKILYLESDVKFARQVIAQLTSEGVKSEVDEISTRKQLTEKLEKNAYDLVFMADHIKDCSGAEALKTIRQLKIFTPVLVFSDFLDEETIVNYMVSGASDFLLKSSLHRLTPAVKRAISNSRNSRTVDYQNFFESAVDLLCTLDKDGNFLGFNQSFTDLFGYTDAEMRDKSFIQFVHPDDQKSTAAQYLKLFEKKKQSVDLVCRMLTHAGDARWLHWKMKIQSNGVINAVVRDITESKNREISLVQSHQNLQKLVELYKADNVKKTLVADQIRDSVVVTDLKGNIISWNKGSEKIFGYSPAEVVGQHIAIIYPEKDYRLIQDEAANVLLEQGEKEFELCMRRKSGEVFEARLTLEVTRDSKGKVNGMLGYAIDMGPVRQQSEDLIKAAQDVYAGDVEKETITPVEQQIMSPLNNPAPALETVTANVSTEETSPEVESDASVDEVTVIVESSNKGGIDSSDSIEQEYVYVQVDDSEFSIMYLEDDLKDISLIEKILGQRPNYRLISTQEPADCLDMARQYQPSLILMDINLTAYDGTDLLQQLKQESALKHIPVVIVSHENEGEKVDAVRKAGVTEILAKPVEVNGFLGMVDSLLFRTAERPARKAKSV